MSELLTTITNQNKNERAFITDAETNEHEINVENVEANHHLALNLLKLVESGDPKATGDYFTEVLDNKIESTDAERDSIFDFLSNQQRIKLNNNMIKIHDEAVAKLEHQSKLTNYPVSDAADNFLRKVNITSQDMEKNVTSRLRATDNDILALRGYEPVLADVKSAKNELDFFSKRLENSERWKEGAIDDYRLDVVECQDIKHLWHLNFVQSHDNKDEKLSPCIDSDVIEKSVEKLLGAASEAKESGESPEDALLSVLNEETKESTAGVDDLIVSFETKFGKHIGKFNNDLVGIKKNIKQMQWMLTTFGNNADGLIYHVEKNPNKTDILLNIHGDLSTELNTLTQLAFKVKQDINQYYGDEDHMFKNEKISTKQNSKASLFK